MRINTLRTRGQDALQRALDALHERYFKPGPAPQLPLHSVFTSSNGQSSANQRVDAFLGSDPDVDDPYWYTELPDPELPTPSARVLLDGTPATEIDDDGQRIHRHNHRYPCANGCGNTTTVDGEFCDPCEDIYEARHRAAMTAHKCLLCPNPVDTPNTLCDGCDDHVNATVALGKKPVL